MRKIRSILLAVFAICFLQVYAQTPTNLVVNSGFEGDFNNMGTPDDWSAAGASEETTIVSAGAKACKIIASNAFAKIEQSTIAVPSPTQGDTYELSFRYYVVTSAGATDIRMQNEWGSEPTHEEGVLKEAFSATQTGVWETKTISTTLPPTTTTVSFTISIKVARGATVIFDDFSFGKVNNAPADPKIVIVETAPLQFSTSLNNPVTQTATINTENLPSDANVLITGTDSQHFSVSPTTIPANASTTVTITYQPTSAGNHSAALSVDCACTLPSGSNPTLILRGVATDPSTTQSIVIDPTSWTFNSVQVGNSDTASFSVTTSNLTQFPSIRMVDNGAANGFFRYTGGALKNGTTTVKVIFKPTTAGTYTKQMKISANGIEAVVDITGVAQGVVTEPKQGDELPLVNANPLNMMNEEFDSVTSNQPISLPQWKNIAEKNYRAWWGYRFDDGNFVAKATANNSTNPAPDEYEMWLYTPPLSFTNAASSKKFTFRVMGQNMAENNLAKFEVYYVDNATPMIKEKIDIQLQTGADYNNTWMPYIIDLNGQNVADVFFMAFRFYVERGGNQNSVIYYVDDVTWGQPTTSLEKTDTSNEKIWANKDKISISSDNHGKATIYNLSGMELYSFDFRGGISTFDINLNKGVYVVKTDRKAHKIVIK